MKGGEANDEGEINKRRSNQGGLEDQGGGGGHVGGAKTFAGTYDSGAGNWGMVGRSQQGWPGYDGLKKASW